MIRNYFTVTLRNFIRNKSYAFINVLGLSIGITSCIIIFLLIKYDLSFDTFHSKTDRIYRVVRDFKNRSGIDYDGVTPYPFASAFRNDFPDVPLVTQFQDQGEILVSSIKGKQMVDNVIFADSLFFKVFDFKVISGNPAKELGQPGRVFLTVSCARKIFKNGASGTIKLANLLDVEVAGIVQDPPAESHIQFSMIVSMPSLTKEFLGLEMSQWPITSAAYSYVALPEFISKEEVENRFNDFVKKYYEPEDAKRETYRLQPLSAIHFDNRYSNSAVDRSDLFALVILATLILSMAIINFVNLATAWQSEKQGKLVFVKYLARKGHT
jgi:putative ABC transport system permease protein